MLIKNLSNLNQLVNTLKKDEILINSYRKISKNILKRLKKNGKIFICGNGGSFAEAQHFTAELQVRLKKNNNRPPIACTTLSSEGSSYTAHINDLNKNSLFLRQFQALASKKDILIALTTSGKSKNINDLLKYTKMNKIYSLLISGNMGGTSKKYSTESLIVKSKDTARIQEIHLLLLHSLAEDIENNLYF